MAILRESDPGLLGQLYNMHTGGITLGAPTLPGIQKQKWEAAATGAISDYKDLLSGIGAARNQPTTLRTATRSARPQPSLSMGASKGVGTWNKGITPPGTGDSIIPPYDTNRVESLAQRFAAPGIRQLRSAMQDTQQGYYENPNVKRMTLRDALSGYGQGLESTMAGALRSGADIYNQEYAPKVAGALQNQRVQSSERMQSEQIASNERIAQLNNEWRAWLSELT